MDSREIKISQENAGERIDAYLANELDMSRSGIVSMLETGGILVNNNRRTRLQKAGSFLFLIFILTELRKKVGKNF